MNPIKKFYQKLLGSSDKKQEEAPEHVEEDDDTGLEPSENCPCYLFFEVDTEGIIKMSCYWDGSAYSIDSFSELLFNLCNGKMTGNIFEFLNHECGEESMDVFLEIVSKYSGLLEEDIQNLSQNPHSEGSHPVVKPSDIAKKNSNPFDLA